MNKTAKTSKFMLFFIIAVIVIIALLVIILITILNKPVPQISLSNGITCSDIEKPIVNVHCNTSGQIQCQVSISI